MKTFPSAIKITTLKFYLVLKEVKILLIYSKNLGFIAFKALGLEIETFAIVPSRRY